MVNVNEAAQRDQRAALHSTRRTAPTDPARSGERNRNMAPAELFQPSHSAKQVNL